MRRNHYIALVVLLIFVWIAILNYTLIKRITVAKDGGFSAANRNLDKFERDLEIAVNNSDNLIRGLKKFLLLQDERLPESDSNNNLRNDRVQNAAIETDDNNNNNNNNNGNDDDDSDIAHEPDATAVLVLACDRVTISKCLDGLVRYRPDEKQFPIIVSQDCLHEKTTEVIKSYGDRIHFIRQPNQQDIDVPAREKKFKGYFKIARHYGWALNQTFVRFNFNSAILVEDDLEVAPDFYEYFRATLPILRRDPTLWCVSAWNDNGIASLVDRTANSLLYRTDFFPGLGWMLLKSLWVEELMTIWPNGYWDDWIRQSEQRRDRACIRPELSRTKTFGKIGVSNGLFYEKHLKYIFLNDRYVDFSKINLTYLTKSRYDRDYEKIVYDSPLVRLEDLKGSGGGALLSVGSGSVRLAYRSTESYRKICKQLGLMDDLKSGVPRTAYRGIVSSVYRRRRVFLVPEAGFDGYDAF